MAKSQHLVWSVIAGWLLAVASALANPAGPASPIGDVELTRELGTPLLRNFSATEYGGAVQNWAVVQDQRGVIYVGNDEDGVLEYDGVRWRRIPIDKRSTIRSLAVAPDGRVYVGGIGEIGYLAADAAGQTHYVSLLERLPEQERDFADVWRTFVTPAGVYFSTFKRLIRISDADVRIWSPAKSFHFAFQIGDELYVREPGRGLLQLRDDELQLVSDGERFANERIYAMLPWPADATAKERSILIGTRTQGWFLFDGTTFLPWPTQADSIIKENALYGAVWLANGSLAIGTLHGGVFLLNAHGQLLGHIDKSNGLADNTVFAVFQDRQGGLWLGLDNGLARAEMLEPLTHFGPREGLEGAVTALHRHAGTLYASTSQGLYRLVSRPREPARFAPVAQIQGVTWTFLDCGDALLVGNVAGVYEIRGATIRLVRPSDHGMLALFPSKQTAARVFIGTHDGVASMRLQNGEWIDEGAIPNTASEVRTLLQQADGDLWLGAMRTGILRLQFAGQEQVGPAATPRSELYSSQHGLPQPPNFVYAVDGAPVFATTQGIFEFNAATGQFSADPRFVNLFPDGPRQVSALEEDARGRLWMYSTNGPKSIKEAGAAVRDATGAYHWDPRPLRQFTGAITQAIHADADGVMWFGGDDGVYRYDPGLPMDYGWPFQALIREVATRNGKSIFAGAGYARPMPKLAFADNALRFEFAAASFGSRTNSFQAYLEGVDNAWSSWTEQANRDYTNIHEGTYRFRVRAMNLHGALSQEGIYDFQVLPPWYRTWLAYLAYLLIAASTFVGFFRWRSFVLRARNAAFTQLVMMRTEQLSNANQALRDANQALAELSSTDALTGLKNRRYLTEHIQPDVATIRRVYQERPVSGDGNTDLLFVMMDLDHFKQVNDHYGHAAGDRVLQQFARILQSVCRDTDTAVRWGGEEFLLVARSTSPESGPIVAERIRALTAGHTFLLDDGKTLRRTCSIGFASYPVLPSSPERFSWEDAVKIADQCLYEAKHGGRNAWVGVHSTQRMAATDDPDLDVADLGTLVSKDYLRRWSKDLLLDRRFATCELLTRGNAVASLESSH